MAALLQSGRLGCLGARLPPPALLAHLRQQQRAHGVQERLQQQQRPQRCSQLRRSVAEERGGGVTEQLQQTTAQQKRIVLAVDASEDSIAAFKWVLNNLLRPEDELHLLHIVPDIRFEPASGSIYYCSSPDPETERMLWQQAKQFFVDNFLTHAKTHGLEDHVSLHLVKESRNRHIGKAVCKKAEELGAEPLVVAAHDRGPIETLLLGSVSKYCVAHSKCPVLLLHPNHSQL